jgi:hypothetical protein
MLLMIARRSRSDHGHVRTVKPAEDEEVFILVYPEQPGLVRRIDDDR